MSKTLRRLALLTAPVALVAALAACDNHDIAYHCGVVYNERLYPSNYQLIRADRSGDWDFCDFRYVDGSVRNFYINIHDHTILGG